MKHGSQGVKLVLLGDSGAGKTSIILQYVRGVFSSRTSPTIVGSFVTKTEKVNGKEIDVSVWDTAGQELYRSLTPMYYRDASAAIIVYDVTSRESFTDVISWIDDVHSNIGNTIIAICGNKTDRERVVSKEEGESLACKLGAFYFETSAENGDGISTLFTTVTNSAVKHLRRSANENSTATVINETDKSNGCC